MQNGRTGTSAIVLFGALPLLAMLLAKSIVFVLIVVGLLGLYGALRDGQISRLLPRSAMFVALAGLAWLTFSSLHTFDGDPRIGQFLKILSLVILGFGAADFVRNLSDDVRGRALDALSIGIAVSLVPAAVGCVIYYGKFWTLIHMIERADPLSIFSTGMVAIAILTPLAVAHLIGQGRVWQAVLLAVSCAGMAVLTSSNAAVVGFVVIAMLAPLLWKFPRVMPRLVMVGCVVGFVLVPAGLATMFGADVRAAVPNIEQSRQTDPDGFRGSMGHRYYIWRFAIARAIERPLAGWGLDTSHIIPGGHVNIAIGKELMPLHPHNATLQLWLELGVPGLLTAAAIFWVIMFARFGAPESVVEVYVKPLTLAVVFVCMNTTYGIWQTWWLSLLALSLAALFLFCRGRDDKTGGAG